MTATPSPKRLTPHHLKIIPLVAEGNGSAEIGKRLFITEGTVKTHLQHIFKILGARNRAHMVHLAYVRGILVRRPPELQRTDLVHRAAGAR